MQRFVFVILLFIFLAIYAYGQNKNYDIPLKIISKPRPTYPKPERGTLCVQGTVTLRVQFLESGEIGKISVVIGLLKEFDENAVEAAKKIQFRPAMKNGKPVTVFKQVQYSFSTY